MTVSKRKLVEADVIKNAEENTITQSELDSIKAKAQQVGDLEKSVESVKTELDTLKGLLGDNKIEDLLKAAKELEDVKKAQAEKLMEDTIEVVKGYNLFEEDKVEDVAKFFVEHAGETVSLIMGSLEKARESIKEFGEAEHGTDVDEASVDVKKSKSDLEGLAADVSRIIKSRKK